MAKHQRAIRNGPPPRKDRAQPLADQVYATLREEILGVQWAPGEMLMEPELAERYGVSKTPVREALRLLVQDGLVTILPRKGYLISPLRLNDVREVFFLRSALEPTLASAAAEVITPDEVAGLRDLVAEQDTADIRAALHFARAFHLELARLAGNNRAQRLLGGLLDETRRLHHLMPRVEEHITSEAELGAHRKIVAALEAGDGDAATGLMRDHIAEVARVMVQAFGGV
ncbi:GntR family transcriptional regulator [Nonomuraea lactucae]|uniref:GntR family transcriptional regulator n=1 Tax=Nonomuraea lactucae TaxID=2249762 RepID=UPI000DE2BC79|nr:GntR family transcriptional regulator [Nonomuraea lactucae]